VPTAFISPFRRLIAVIALWLVVLQSFLTGVATAQAGAALADPLAAAVICHSGGGAGDPAAPALPDAGKVWHLCCSYCMAAAPVLLPPSAQVARANVRVVNVILPLADFAIVIAREAVRAGPSQGPPGQA
jgi:hypothetical protein